MVPAPPLRRNMRASDGVIWAIMRSPPRPILASSVATGLKVMMPPRAIPTGVCCALNWSRAIFKAAKYAASNVGGIISSGIPVAINCARISS